MKNPTLEINSPLLRRRDENRISCSAGCSQFSGCHRYKSIPWPDKPTCILSFFTSFPAELPTLKSHTEFRSAAETDMTSLQICPWKISLSVRTSTSRFSLFSPSSLFSYFLGLLLVFLLLHGPFCFASSILAFVDLAQHHDRVFLLLLVLWQKSSTFVNIFYWPLPAARSWWKSWEIMVTCH